MIPRRNIIDQPKAVTQYNSKNFKYLINRIKDIGYQFDMLKFDIVGHG